MQISEQVHARAFTRPRRRRQARAQGQARSRGEEGGPETRWIDQQLDQDGENDVRTADIREEAVGRSEATEYEQRRASGTERGGQIKEEQGRAVEEDHDGARVMLVCTVL